MSTLHIADQWKRLQESREKVMSGCRLALSYEEQNGSLPDSVGHTILSMKLRLDAVEEGFEQLLLEVGRVNAYVN
jgi:hypothetical protein